MSVLTVSPALARRTPTTLNINGEGVPTALTWLGRRYDVTDTPTRITEADVILPDAITHPLPGTWTGWRFQGRDAAGDQYVIDVRPMSDGSWSVIGLYA